MVCVITCHNFPRSDETLQAFLFENELAGASVSPSPWSRWNVTSKIQIEEFRWHFNISGITADPVVFLWPEWLPLCAFVKERFTGQCRGAGVVSFQIMDEIRQHLLHLLSHNLCTKHPDLFLPSKAPSECNEARIWPIVERASKVLYNWFTVILKSRFTCGFISICYH